MLPPYLFVEIDRTKRLARQQGRDIIDLGVGDPDTGTPGFIVEALKEAVDDPATHRYALDAGMPELRRAIADWYSHRFGVSLDPEKEVLPLIGSKEGIAHLPLALINQKDTALVPDPCYPPYRSGVIFCGGQVEPMPLLEENGYLADLKRLSGPAAKRAKIMYLNYPNNPTGATAEISYFNAAAGFALKNNIVVCHDAAYSEISFDGFSPPSFLQAEGGKDACVEFHSLSKTFNMTGWRLGFAVGNEDVVSALAKVKSNIDSGVFGAIQRAGIAALKNYKAHVGPLRQLYQGRRDVLCSGLESIGWQLQRPAASFYVWCRCPKGRNSIDFAGHILDEADIVVTPGVGFGRYGEGYIRMALTVEETRLKEAVSRLKKAV